MLEIKPKSDIDQTNSQEKLHLRNTKGFSFEWNHTQLKFKPGTVEKNESNICPPQGNRTYAFAMSVQCSCDWATEVADKSVRSRIFSTLPGLNLSSVWFHLKLKPFETFRIYPIPSEVPKNHTENQNFRAPIKNNNPVASGIRFSYSRLIPDRDREPLWKRGKVFFFIYFRQLLPFNWKGTLLPGYFGSYHKMFNLFSPQKFTVTTVSILQTGITFQRKLLKVHRWNMKVLRSMVAYAPPRSTWVLAQIWGIYFLASFCFVASVRTLWKVKKKIRWRFFNI